jgi:hypothetical protein
MRKLMLAIVAVLAVLVTGATAATASTLTISPSGPIRHLSIGRLTFRTTEGVSIVCVVRLLGTASSTATGELTEVARPEVNPVIARFTEGTASECTGGGMRLLGAGEKIQYRPLEWLIRHFNYLIESIGLGCLYEDEIYEHGTSLLLLITEQHTVRRIELILAGCKEIRVTGALQLLEPNGTGPTITLR